MDGTQIIKEILWYLDDETYNYAVMIDGEWGCGKTYFIKKSLIKEIEIFERKKKGITKG